MRLRSLAGSLILVGVVAVSGCRSKKQAAAAKDEVEAPTPATAAAQDVPTLTALPLGKRELTGYAYSLGPARAAYKAVRAAEKAGDWKAVEAAARKALRMDRGHLSAHWSLALALARQERYAEVAVPLSAAVAGDYMRWGDRSLNEKALEGFLASRYGQAYKTLAEEYRAQFLRLVGSHFLVVGRRGKPWMPKKTGNVLINHRAEIYAYSMAPGRYVRLSRTNASLVGYVRAPERSELAYVSYRRAWLPNAKEAASGAKPHIREVVVGTIDTEKAKICRREVRFKDVAEIDVSYRRRGKGASTLVARVRYAKPPANVPKLAWYRLDTLAGKATLLSKKRKLSRAEEILRVRYRYSERRRPRVRGIAADWSERAAGVLELASTRKTVALNGDESASRDSIVWSPNQTRLALTTVAADPCGRSSDDRVVKLYAVDAASGELSAIAEGEGDFAATWFDDNRLAYVDTSAKTPAVRVVDVGSGGELAKLSGLGGVVTGHLTERRACRPPVDEESSPSDPPEVDDNEPQPRKGMAAQTPTPDEAIPVAPATPPKTRKPVKSKPRKLDTTPARTGN